MKFTTELKFLIFFVLQNISVILAKSRFNVSYAQLDTCSEYDIDSDGYAYRKFFMIHNFDNNQIATKERLHLKFYVITNKDAHILLSVTAHPRVEDRVYEIVIGAGENSFSAIRTRIGRFRVATNQDANLVSPYDPTPIEIVQTKNADVLVYVPGFKTEPLLNFTDASPLSISYISFSSFGSTRARWFYDCEFDRFGHEIEAETLPVSADQRLISNLALKSLNKSLPANLRYVDFAFQVRSVAFEQTNAILKTRLNLVLSWLDEKLQWEPKDYDDIKELIRPSLDIWTPDVIVLNSAMDSLGSLIRNPEIKIQANGSVTLMANNVEISTWCVDSERNWPNERLHCGINLGINEFSFALDAPIRLNYDLSRPISNEPVNTLSEWYFDEINVDTIDTGKSTRFTPKGILQTMNGDVSIEFTLKRNTSFYRNVFVMPVFACETFIILSFLLRGYRRGALLLVVFVLAVLGLMFITKRATPHYVPNLMISYQHILRITIFCYYLHIFITWLEMYPPKAKPSEFLLSLINFSPLRFVLCMRFADATEYVTIQEKPWTDLAKLCSNFSFIIVTIAFMIMNAFLLSV